MSWIGADPQPPVRHDPHWTDAFESGTHLAQALRNPGDPMRLATLLALSTPLLFTTGCSYSSGYGAMDIGVTPGGQQDLELARQIIEGGGIPAEGQFTAEGLFSEHDLPLTGQTCDALLCPRGAAALTEPVDASGPTVLTQLGFGSNVSPTTWQRPPLDLAVAIDKSGSMEGERFDLVRAALLESLAFLDDNDRMAIVTYGSSAKVEQRSIRMDESGKEKIRSVVESLSSGGSTNMERGMQKAFNELKRTEGAEQRVLLFTDVQPNVGATSDTEFSRMVDEWAAEDVHLSVFAVSTSMSADVFDAMSRVRGANAFVISDEESTRERFATDFEFMMVPVAFDLDIQATPGAALRIDEGLGMPVAEGQAGMGASTLFFSSKSGGMGITLQPLDITPATDPDAPIFPETGSTVATLDVSWTQASGAVADNLTIPWAGGTAYTTSRAQADQLGVFRMAVLTDELRALRAAALLCNTDETAAQAEDPTPVIEAAIAHLEEAAAIDTLGTVDHDVAMLQKLADNVATGASCEGYNYGDTGY